MRNIYSSEGVPTHKRLQHWNDFIFRSATPVAQRPIGDAPFYANVEFSNLGSLGINNSHITPWQVVVNSKAIRNPVFDPEVVSFCVKIKGTSILTQDDKTAITKTGDAYLYDWSRPMDGTHQTNVEQLIVTLPRRRLENILGSTRHYSALAIGSDLPTSILLRSFLENLRKMVDRLTPDVAQRMESVCVDLIAANIAERMACEPPEVVRPSLIVQRAKMYVEQHLSEQELTPQQVATASGVSLRHLQFLFHERGRSIGAWIWQRRLDLAAEWLADPVHARRQIGSLAYACGFSDQAHFSSRFRARYGMTASEFRRAALLAQTQP